VMDSRHKAYPDVPSMAEAGYPGVGGGQWQAAFVPAGTPREIVEKLSKAFQDALKQPQVVAAYEKGDIIAPEPHTPEQAQAWIAGEMKKWREVISQINLVVD